MCFGESAESRQRKPSNPQAKDGKETKGEIIYLESIQRQLKKAVESLKKKTKKTTTTTNKKYPLLYSYPL